jgi:hypothetical protein
MSDATPAAAAGKDKVPVSNTAATSQVLPNLPDPIATINAADKALKSLADEQKRLREELAGKDPLERKSDTLEFAEELLIVVEAIEKIKLERSAAIRRLARGV